MSALLLKADIIDLNGMQAPKVTPPNETLIW
jgi:hypothetical protein